MQKHKHRMNTIHTLALVAAGTLFVSGAPLHAAEADDRIESSFSKSYAYTTHLKNDAIKAVSHDGVVTLTGQVDNPSHKDLAQETVANLPGVRRVDNRLRVKLEGTEKSDTWIQAKVRSVLALHRNVGGSSTQVDIKDGVITLRGLATSEAQRELLSEYTEDVDGVLRVINVMTVAKRPAKPNEMVVVAIDDASITAQVKVALRSHRSTSALSTKVETTEGVVTVSGTARNLAEKTLVSKLAADILGVKSVINTMTL